MINLFSLEILIGLIAGIFIGWVLKNIFSKKENVGSEENTNYVHRGIAKRQFEREFTLSDDIVVKGCDLSNGMLTIEHEKVIPEEKRARLIPIGKNNIKSIN